MNLYVGNLGAVDTLNDRAAATVTWELCPVIKRPSPSWTPPVRGTPLIGNVDNTTTRPRRRYNPLTHLATSQPRIRVPLKGVYVVKSKSMD
ncbi:hypothetical protein AVEN_38789-1 [Araneus ventricosus]|uniref:Uncharacterized protein n=1 Tax=Araneus ventricosus TaxID=182803 RepID=A0A4Y2Q8U9_ARAVE|nr:hypothetical protein AVEN_38789-1 [Araneus ventricosus]